VMLSVATASDDKMEVGAVSESQSVTIFVLFCSFISYFIIYFHI
jgi:hypothetical protein